MDTTWGTVCGGYTYELEYQPTGPLYNTATSTPPSIAHYTLGTCTTGSGNCDYTGTTTDFNWIGTHPFKIKATLGTFNAGLGRGTNGDGLYETVYSPDFNVIIANPCLNSAVNAVVISSMSTDVFRVTPVSQTIAGPSNTISVSLGNGFDLCGSLKYELQLQATGTRYEPTWLGYGVQQIGSAADVISFSVQTDDPDNVGVYNLQLHVSLVNYPSSTPLIVPF